MGEESVMNKDEETWNQKKQTLIDEVAERLINGDLDAKIQAARDIRKLVRKSSVKTRSKFAAAGVIQPLVSMLLSPNLDAREASLLALLNLAVRNERLTQAWLEIGLFGKQAKLQHFWKLLSN